MKLKISNFTITFVYFSLFLMLMAFIAGNEGCGGPTSYSVPDFYSPVFTRLTPEVFQSTSSVGLTEYNVRIKVADNSAAPGVTLHAKKYGASSFLPFKMLAQAGSIYSTPLPSDYISFEYYFSATDGINSSLFPAGAPSTTYSQLVGVPTVDGNKYYGTEPPTVTRPSSAITFSADITSDTPLESGYPKLHVQESGATNKISYLMTATGEVNAGTQKYTIVLSGDKFASEKKYEYQIEVKNMRVENKHEAYTVYYPQSGYNSFEINASVNLPPIAILNYNAKKKYFVTTDTSGASDVDLDASSSYDPEDGKTGLVYKWTQVAGPNVSVKDAGSHCYFTPSSIGIYSFSLQVQDKNGNLSNTAYTTPAIEVTNTVIPSENFPSIVTTEIVLAKSASPFTVISNITVKNGGRLKIERGVELKFEQEAGLIIENGGIINADGDSTNRITLHSTRTGDIKGQWSGISIIGDISYPSSSLNYCDISSAKTAIYVKDSKNPTISMCSIKSNNDGIYSDNSTITINQNDIFDNGTDGVICVSGSISTISTNKIYKNKRYGLRCDNSKAEITQNNVYENNYGMLVANSYRANSMIVNIYGNTFTKNTDGMRVENADPIILANQFSENNDNGLLCKNAMPQLNSNVFYSNHDSGIQMIDCNYRKGAGALVNNSTASLYSCEIEIANNVIAASGADGIEIEGSNPIINHNIIAYNLNTGIYIKSYSDSNGNNVINSEASGLLIINNLIKDNSRSAISRNGKPPDHTGGYFANSSIMINNNNFIGMTIYSDVKTGEDLSPVTNEVYMNTPFYDTDSSSPVVFTGANYQNINNLVTLHAQRLDGVAANQVRWNDGRNLSVAPKYSNDISSASALGSSRGYDWALDNIPIAPRRGSGSYNMIEDGTYFDVSYMINSGTSYSFYQGRPNTDIGIMRWVKFTAK